MSKKYILHGSVCLKYVRLLSVASWLQFKIQNMCTPYSLFILAVQIQTDWLSEWMNENILIIYFPVSLPNQTLEDRDYISLISESPMQLQSKCSVIVILVCFLLLETQYYRLGVFCFFKCLFGLIVLEVPGWGATSGDAFLLEGSEGMQAIIWQRQGVCVSSDLSPSYKATSSQSWRLHPDDLI